MAVEVEQHEKKEQSDNVTFSASDEMLENGSLISIENGTMVSSVFDIRASRSLAVDPGDLQLDESLNYFVKRDLSKRWDDVSICISAYSGSLNGSFDEESLAALKTNTKKDNKNFKRCGDSHDQTSTRESRSQSSCSEISTSAMDQRGCFGRYNRSSTCFKFSLTITILLLGIFSGMVAFLLLSGAEGMESFFGFSTDSSNDTGEAVPTIDPRGSSSTQLPVPTHPPANEKDQDHITNDAMDKPKIESTEAPKKICKDDYTKLFNVNGVSRDCSWLAGTDLDSQAYICNPFLSAYSICLETCGSCEKAVVP